MTSNMPLILGFGLAVAAVSVGVWGAKGTRGLDGFGGSRRRRGLGGRRTTRQIRGHAEQHELQLFIDNDGDLYRQQTTPIHKNLVTKIARGDYDATKAEKLWMYLVDAGAKKYAREAGDGGTWHDMFPISDRRAVAKELNRHFLVEQKLGNYDHLLPKKYARA
jgi:hypothetical protein